MQVIKYWREIGAALVVAVLCLTAWHYGAKWSGGDVETSTPVSVPVLKEEEKKVKTVKETKHPNGTVITETSESETTSREKSKVAYNRTSTPASKYSLGVYVNPLDYKHVQVDASARLGNLPLSAVVGYDVKHYEVKVGVRFDF